MDDITLLKTLKLKLLAAYDLLDSYHATHKGTTLCSQDEQKVLSDIAISVETELHYQIHTQEQKEREVNI